MHVNLIELQIPLQLDLVFSTDFFFFLVDNILKNKPTLCNFSYAQVKIKKKNGKSQWFNPKIILTTAKYSSVERLKKLISKNSNETLRLRAYLLAFQSQTTPLKGSDKNH